MMKDWAGQEEGQALVVVGMAMLLLVTALALGIDWGYGYVARRTAQNAADAASLAAGRALATNFVPGEPFTVTQQDVWAAACRASSTNTMSGSSALHSSLGVWFSSDPATPFSEDPLSSWYGITAPSGDCAQVPPGGDDVLGNAVYVRVRVATGYRSLFGATTGQQIEVAANARVRLTGAGSTSGPVAVPLGPVGDSTVGPPGIGLSGSTTAPNVAMWPLVMHYQPQDWTSPGSELVLIDWDSRSGRNDNSLFVSFSHYSPHEQDATNSPRQVHQLITESDYTGTPNTHHGHPATGFLVSDPRATGCPRAPFWDTNGVADLGTTATCDLPNWFAWGYRGSLSLGTRWNSASWTGSPFEGLGPLELPEEFTASRVSCLNAAGPPYFTVPSCPDSVGSSNTGDWVETIRSGVSYSVIAAEMRTFIGRYGRVDPSTGTLAVVVNVFIWDCGESFDGNGVAGDRWEPVPSSGDCSTVDFQSASIDRVHLFSVVPVTISMDDIDTTFRRQHGEVYVTARWGDAFGNAGSCALTPLNPRCAVNSLMNSAYLIPDE